MIKPEGIHRPAIRGRRFLVAGAEKIAAGVRRPAHGEKFKSNLNDLRLS
jgi:hypothetical protein